MHSILILFHIQIYILSLYSFELKFLWHSSCGRGNWMSGVASITMFTLEMSRNHCREINILYELFSVEYCIAICRQYCLKEKRFSTMDVKNCKLKLHLLMTRSKNSIF